MAKVKIQGHASGTGVLTVTAPNTSTDRTITLPDSTGTLLTSEGAVVVNESGADVDFRVESDTDTHALFVQGSDGAVGIGTTAPLLGKVHLLAAGTSDASLENVAHFGKNSTSRAGLQILANATQVDVGMQAQAGAGNLDLSFSSLVSGTRNERMRILSAGGLTFNGDTAAANALDDYEEGTFTPTANNLNVALASSEGSYTKVGRLVTFSAKFAFQGTTDGSNVQLSGLPFTVGDSQNNRGACSIGYIDDADTGRSILWQGTDRIELYNFSGFNRTYQNISSKTLHLGGSYYVD